MEVHACRFDVDLQAAHALGAHPHYRLGCAPLDTVRSENHVASEQSPVGSDKRAKVAAADLFLTLEKELDIDWQRALGLQDRFNCGEGKKQVGLHVGSATGEDLAVLDYRLERRAVPKLQGLGRLHIEVA